MSNAEKAKLYSKIAAACFAVAALYHVVLFVYRTALYSHFYLQDAIFASLDILPCASLAIASYLRKKNVMGILPLALFAISFVLENAPSSYRFNWYGAFCLLAFIFLFVAMISPKKTNTSQYLANLSPTLVIVGTVIQFFQYLELYLDLGDIGYLIFVISLPPLILSAGLLFLALWYKHDDSIPVKVVVYPEEPKPLEIGNADKLLIYKDLLDSGAITQEEFAQKKRELLK